MEEDKPRPRRESRTWQSRKSANTRYRLLEATLDVLAERGYANTSITKIAQAAKVSRGAVQFHFPTKQSAMESVIGHIFQRRLDTYRAEMAKVPPQTDILEHALQVYWRQVTRAEFIAQQELELAARTDRQLARTLHAAYREFVRQSRLPFLGNFPQWREAGRRYETAANLAQYLIEGMASGYIEGYLDDAAIDDLLAVLQDMIEQLLEGRQLMASGGARKGRLSDRSPSRKED